MALWHHWPPVIYLSAMLPQQYSSPPLGRTSSPFAPIYLTLQLAGGAARNVAVAPGELLPHLFTLTMIFTGIMAVVFCHLKPQSHLWLPVRKCDALCCPDFPPISQLRK